jgi:hypothetical protein
MYGLKPYFIEHKITPGVPYRETPETQKPFGRDYLKFHQEIRLKFVYGLLISLIMPLRSKHLEGQT